MLPFAVKKLCTPARVYFIVACVAYVMAAYQSFQTKGLLAVGAVRCVVPNCGILFLIKAAYIVFWTYVLNLICRDGHRTVAWALVVAPFVAVFAAMVVVEKAQKKKKVKQ